MQEREEIAQHIKLPAAPGGIERGQAYFGIYLERQNMLADPYYFAVDDHFFRSSDQRNIDGLYREAAQHQQ